MDTKFKVGDRVLVKDNYREEFARGQMATIRYDDDTPTLRFLIEFDNEFDWCHDGDGKCRNKHGWWIDEAWLQPIERIKLGIFKKENKEMELLNIYFDRKQKEIKEKYEEKAVKIRCKDPVYKELNDIAKKYEGVRGVVCYAGCDFEYTDEIRKALVKNDKDCDVQLDTMFELKHEIAAQLEVCETYEQKQAILKAYNIIDEQGKLIK